MRSVPRAFAWQISRKAATTACMGRIPYGGANSRFPRRYPQRALRPPFRLAKFEGDAALSYAPAGKVDGALLQDAIEQAYFAFRKRLRNIREANSCACEACRGMAGST